MSRGNMYNWITGTWNPIGGECLHGCHYCYVKSFKIPALKAKYSGLPRLIEHELKKNLGRDKFWFVGSCFDMWARAIPEVWIIKTIDHCLKFKNKYLFQSKNPHGIFIYREYLPKKSVIGTTIESNLFHPEMGNAPAIPKRARYLNELAKDGFKTMVTIEPIMEFSLDGMVPLIELCRPKWVNIGADSGGHNLPEPPAGKVRELITELSKFTEVKIKKNLNRILKGEP